MTSARHLHPVPDDAPGLRVVSDAAGRVRFDAPGLRSATGLAVAVEEALDGVEGVRQVHAFPRTGSLVVWYDRDHCSPATITEAYRGVTASTPHDEPSRPTTQGEAAPTPLAPP